MWRTLPAATLALLLAVMPAAAVPQTTTSKQGTSARHASAHKSTGKPGTSTAQKGTAKGKGRRSSARNRGQKSIDAARAREIQQALIREHYLNGEPSGTWDQRSKDAMARYQRDHGWQDKITPDARALIKLGLGPRHDGLLNPDQAAVSPSPAANPAPTAAAEKTAPADTSH